MISIEKAKNLARENNCNFCGLTNTQHKKIYSKSLHVHHIDNDRENNITTNLVTLCVVCHMLEHHNSHNYLERKKEILELYNHGISYQEIGSKYNISRQRIHQIIKLGT